MPATRPPRAQPTEKSLHEAALAHLARFAATRDGLRRVLLRRIDRWVQEAQPEAHLAVPLRAAVDSIIDRLTAEGVLDDAAFAQRRGLRLLQAGRSPHAAIAQLRSKGVAADLAHQAVPDRSLDAALILARRRRVGPFRIVAIEAPPEAQKEQSILARAGFSREVTLAALRMDREEAERRIIEFRKQG